MLLPSFRRKKDIKESEADKQAEGDHWSRFQCWSKRGPEPVKVLLQRSKYWSLKAPPELLSDILLCLLISATCSSNKWVCNKQVYEFVIKKFAAKSTAKQEFWTEQGSSQDSFIQTSLQSLVCCHGDGLMFEKIPSTLQRIMFFTDQQLKWIILRSLLLSSLCK